MHKLSREFYAQDTIKVAQSLLGHYLIHVVDHIEHIGKIVEVEAYLGPHDRAAHSARGKTKRTEVMWGPPGFAYVDLSYGIYHCMNVVTENDGHDYAVLLSAIQPIHTITQRTAGPGLLCQALPLDKK